MAAVPLSVMVRFAVKPLPQSVGTLLAAAHDEVAATAGTAPAPPTTASPNAASNAAATTVTVLRNRLSKSFISKHLHEVEIAHRPAPLRQATAAKAPSGS